jgi:uncharacterized protein CbrC (UPF0167 family)
LPTFEYHPNVYDNGIVDFKVGICDCCGKTVKAYVSSIHARERAKCICMNCVKDGSAVKKFDGDFVQHSQKISDSTKKEILHCKTPGYISWQGEYWLACCDDYCEYIGEVGTNELDELGITDEVIKEYREKISDSFDVNEIKDWLEAKGSFTGYLFKCKHCGKYHINIDSE